MADGVTWRKLGAAMIVSALLSASGFTSGHKLVTYWGQNESRQERKLADYCDNPSFDVITIAFVSSFPDNGLPKLSISSNCSDTFPGTSLKNCMAMSSSIGACQAKGRKVTITLGGPIGPYAVTTGANVAYIMWNMFLGGKNTSFLRPFGNAVLDGVNLDVVHGSGSGYADFVRELRALMNSDKSRQFTISVTPRCVHPDPILNTVLQNSGGSIDDIYVKFFNDSSCDGSNLTRFLNAGYKWLSLANKLLLSTGKKVSMLVSLPAHPDAVASGALLVSSLEEVLRTMKGEVNFGGVVLWDAGWDDKYRSDFGISFSTVVRRKIPSKDVPHKAVVEISLPTKDADKNLITSALSDFMGANGFAVTLSLQQSRNFEGTSITAWEMIVAPFANPVIELCEAFQKILNENKVSNLTALKSIIASTDCCFAASFGSEEYKGVYNFDTDVVNEAYVHTRPCQHVSQLTAYPTREMMTVQCSFNTELALASWSAPNMSLCPAKSLLTQKLDKLSKTPVVSANVLDISTQLVRDIDPLYFTTFHDVRYIAEIIQNVVKVEKKNNEINNNLLEAVSKVLDGNVYFIATAEVQARSSTVINKQLRSIAESIALQSTKLQILQKKNLALLVQRSAQFSNGISIWSPELRTKENLNLRIKNGRLNGTEMANCSVSIYLPSELIKQIGKDRNYLYSFTMANTKLYLSEEALQDASNATSGYLQALSKISQPISLTVGNSEWQNLTHKVEFFVHVNSTEKYQGAVCAYWNETLDTSIPNVYGGWSTNGCQRVPYHDQTIVKCECNHLTNFALILDASQDGSNPLALSIITWVGCGFSIAGLTITMATYITFRKLRAPLPSKILLCFSISLLTTLVVFLAGVRHVGNKALCKGTAAMMQYLVLATFFWMSVQAAQLHRSFVHIFYGIGISDKTFLMAASAYAWGVPMIIVGMTLAISEESYGPRPNDRNQYCLLHGRAFYYALLLPVCIILTANFIILIKVMISISNTVKSRSKIIECYDTIGFLSRNLRIALSLSTLLGLTWVFAILAVGNLRDVFQWLFCIFNSLQGFFVFAFFTIKSKDVRNEWKRMLGKVIKGSQVMSTSTEPRSPVKRTCEMADSAI